jgi:hypothetical protein
MEDMKQNMMEEVLSAWWEKWLSQVVASLFSYNKWKEKHPSLNTGDVCLAKHGHKVDNADNQLCKVIEAEKDAKMSVMTKDLKMTSILKYCFNKDVKICEESNIGEPEAADLAALDDTGDDITTAPQDDCLDLEAADLSEVHLGAEGLGHTNSALPAYCELMPGMFHKPLDVLQNPRVPQAQDSVPFGSSISTENNAVSVCFKEL